MTFHRLFRLNALPVALTAAMALGAVAAHAPAMAQDAKKDAKKTETKKDTAKDPVVATVDGSEIKLSDLQALYADLPARIRRIPFTRIYRPLLEQVIQMKLLSAKARADGLDKSAEVQRKLSAYADRVLQQAYLRAHVDKTVTDDQLKKAYEVYVKSFRGAEEIKARHILVKTKKEAMAVIEALEKGGKFADIAKEKSIGPSKASGGDLGWFAKGQMVKPFAEAAYALKKGAYSKTPVKTQFGWHVILLEDRRTKAPPKYEAMKANLKRAEGRKLAVAEIKRLRTAAKIVRFGPDGKPLETGGKPEKKDDKKPGDKKDDKKKE